MCDEIECHSLHEEAENETKTDIRGQYLKTQLSVKYCEVAQRYLKVFEGVWSTLMVFRELCRCKGGGGTGIFHMMSVSIFCSSPDPPPAIYGMF